MLALKQALSLSSIKTINPIGSLPMADMVAWYKKDKLITQVASVPPGIFGFVSEWGDSSGNGYDMYQNTASERPLYNDSSELLTFTSQTLPTVSTNLELSGNQITLTADFTIGLKIHPSTDNGAFLSDNTTANEFFKFSSEDKISFKLNGSSTHNLNLDGGTFGDDYIIITRVSNIFTLWQNGVEQTTNNPEQEGDCLIDVIGVRKTDGNGYDGNLEEIVIYDTSNADLTEQINNRLSSL